MEACSRPGFGASLPPFQRSSTTITGFRWGNGGYWKMCRLCNPSCTCTSTLHKHLALRVAQASQLTEILRVRTWLSTSIREPLRNELRAVRSRSGGSMKHYTKHVWMLGLLAATACVTEDDTSASTLESQTSIPNNHPFQNSLGT